MRPGPVRHALRRAPRAVVVPALGALVSGMLLAGCATDDPDREAGDEATAPPAPTEGTPAPATTTTETGPPPPEQTQDADMTQPPGSTPPTGDAAGVLTERDSGARVALTVGEERPLQLGSAWSWSEPVVDGAAVTLTPVDYLVDPGYVEWLVTGATSGSATVEVVGEPVCGDTTVCPPTTVTLAVDVRG